MKRLRANTCFVLLISLFITTQLSAQFPKYCVYFIKGTATIFTQENKLAFAKRGSLLFANDRLSVPNDKTKVYVYDKDGNFLTLEKKGVYYISDLDNLLVFRSTGVTSRYLEFLWGKMSNPKLKMGILDKEHFSGSWGGVMRSNSNCSVPLYPKEGECVSADTIQFRWLTNKGSEKYVFKLFNTEEIETTHLVITDTTLNVITIPMRSPAKKMYYWSVRATNEKDCRRTSNFHFFVVTKKIATAEINQLIQKIEIDEPILRNLLIADALAGRGYFAEADKYLTKVVHNNAEK